MKVRIMSFSLPVRKNLVHKAIEPRKLSASIAAIVAERDDDIWEVKYDGCHGILVKCNGKAYGFSRQGEPIAGAMDRQLQALEAIYADNFVLFVEGWNPNSIHSIINGDFRRGHKEGDLYSLKAVVFDHVPLDDFMKGVNFSTYEVRSQRVADTVFALKTFGYGHLFEKAFSARTKAECVAYVADRQDNHGEIFAIDGFMRKARDGIWTAGAGSCGTILKDKAVLSVDLKVEGLVEGKGKFVGMLGAYECTYNGKPQLVGGGKLTDKQRRSIWIDQLQADGGIGSIIEVHALGESTNGLLREPRYIRTRFDKTEGE
jgi:DNA ligase-1